LSSSSSSSSSVDGVGSTDVLSRTFAINGWQKSINSSEASSADQQDMPSYSSSSSAVPSITDSTPAAAATTAASAAAGAARAAAMQQQLGSFEGVERVELNAQWGLMHRSLSPRRWQQRQQQRRNLQQQQQQQQQQRRSLKQATAGATCGDRISYNPDYQVGRAAEGTPYGVSMVSSTAAAALAAATAVTAACVSSNGTGLWPTEQLQQSMCVHMVLLICV
jgi:hypothetical protein